MKVSGKLSSKLSILFSIVFALLKNLSAEEEKTVWVELADLGLEGRGWDDKDLKSRYDRLPATAEGVVPKEVAGLSPHSTGNKQLYFLSASVMLGSDNEAPIDGVHPNDLGMMRQADVFVPMLKKILNENK